MSADVTADPVEAWWSEGEYVQLRLRGAERTIFVRRMGSGPTLTLLHGYPASSYQWARVAPDLARWHTLVMPDFLGLGASDKPREHDYSLIEQADLVEALWAHGGVSTTRVAAHDYGSSVAQELLARRSEGSLSVTLADMTLMNGGIYPDLHRRTERQNQLIDPDVDWTPIAELTEETFTSDLAVTFAPGRTAVAHSRQMWRGYSRDGGCLNSYLLTRFIRERETHRDRWGTALESTDVPLQFVWGLLDPVAGAHIAKRIRERMPAAALYELPDVGHWPSLEAPVRVMAAILAHNLSAALESSVDTPGRGSPVAAATSPAVIASSEQSAPSSFAVVAARGGAASPASCGCEWPLASGRHNSTTRCLGVPPDQVRRLQELPSDRHHYGIARLHGHLPGGWKPWNDHPPTDRAFLRRPS